MWPAPVCQDPWLHYLKLAKHVAKLQLLLNFHSGGKSYKPPQIYSIAPK